jgi:hypothetical protein
MRMSVGAASGGYDARTSREEEAMANKPKSETSEQSEPVISDEPSTTSGSELAQPRESQDPSHRDAGQERADRENEREQERADRERERAEA